jgi:hypothetical protein
MIGFLEHDRIFSSMIRVVPILFGALFTLATGWSLGMLLLRNVAPSLDAWERRLLALIAGSACLSEIMFALSAAKLVYRGVLLAVGLASIGYAIYSGAFRAPESRSRLSRPCGDGSSSLLSRPSPGTASSTRWRPSTVQTACRITSARC